MSRTEILKHRECNIGNNVIARKLRPYFISDKVVVRTYMHFKSILEKPDHSGRMVKWVVKLNEYGVDFELRTTIKAQALADFL